jgi:probable DNA metabolism protein
MQLVVYDGTFEGFLTAVFHIYGYKFTDVHFASEGNYQKNIFDKAYEVTTDEAKAARVWKGLEQKLSETALEQLYKTFLCEKKDIENMLLAYIQYAFTSNASIEQDYSHPAVLAVTQTAKTVYREKHRMEAFIRFQLTGDGLYYAVIEPDFNVLPLLKKHFYDRYADQCWLIYDVKRKYGLYYDKEQVVTVAMTFTEENASGKDIRNVYDTGEELYQKLWKQYFNSVNISARKNMKLHIQHMPRRYWKYLTEKK